MKLNLKYVADEKGKRLAVIVPIRQWKILQREYAEMEQQVAKLNQMMKLKKDFTKSFREVHEMMSGKRKQRTLDELIKEL